MLVRARHNDVLPVATDGAQHRGDIDTTWANEFGTHLLA